MTVSNESEKQIIERVTMETVSGFLQESGLSVSVDWERPPTDPFPDYRAEVNGQRWSFEVTQLLKMPPPYYKKQAGSYDPEASMASTKFSHVPTDATLFHRLLDKAFDDKSKPSRLALLGGDSYCLIIVNGQSDSNDAWSGMNLGQFNHSAINSVIIVHYPVAKPGGKLIIPDPHDMQPVCQVWKNGFGVDLPKHTINDLYPV